MWLFWLFFGAVLGACITVLGFEIKKRDIKIQWWGWISGAFGLIFFVLGIQTLVGSYQEMRPQAGWLGLIFFLIPAIILFVLAARSSKTKK